VNLEQEIRLAAFFIADEEYAVDIRRVREIIVPRELTVVQDGPVYIDGVINLHGVVVPIVNMRRRFSLPEADMPRRRIIVMTIDRRILGMGVDRVTEVVRTHRRQIKSAPKYLGSGRAPFFLGVCEHEGRSLILLDVRSLVASDDAVLVPSVAELMNEKV